MDIRGFHCVLRKRQAFHLRLELFNRAGVARGAADLVLHPLDGVPIFPKLFFSAAPLLMRPHVVIAGACNKPRYVPGIICGAVVVVCREAAGIAVGQCV